MFFRPDTLENILPARNWSLAATAAWSSIFFVIEDTLDPLTLGDVTNRAGDQYPLLGFV